MLGDDIPRMESSELENVLLILIFNKFTLMKILR